MPTVLTSQVWNDAVEWDRPTWMRAFTHWERFLDSSVGPQTLGLEVGGKRGGGALFLAYRYGMKVECSDLGGPEPAAEAVHTRYGVRDLITYTDQDATKLNLPDASVDVVMFKSVLGSIGRALGRAGLEAAVAEMARVLRPGGVLLFAENLSATKLHQVVRERVRHWATEWHYMQIEELNGLLRREFSDVDMHSTGMLAVFAPNNPQVAKATLAWVDSRIERFFSPESRYLAYGVATR